MDGLRGEAVDSSPSLALRRFTALQYPPVRRFFRVRLVTRGDAVVARAHELPPLSNDDFHDFTHVRASGRHKISERIAEILARLEGTR